MKEKTVIEERNTEQSKDDLPEQKRFIAWVEEHKMEILFAGVSFSALIVAIVWMKNKDAINTLWESLEKKIEKDSVYSAKWFEDASLEELEKAREVVRLDYVNPNLDMGYRNQCWNLLSRFDRAIGKITRSRKAVGYPVHSSHGWHLPSDD